MNSHSKPSGGRDADSRKTGESVGFKTFAAIVLVIVLVLMISGGTDWRGCSGPQTGMLRGRTIAFLAEIQAGLDNYKIDHGAYPPNPADNRGTAAEDGAQILYQYLSGDFDLDGEFDTDHPENKIYVESLDFKSSQGTVGIDSQGRYVAMDPYGNLVRYLCDPIDGRREVRTLNPTYDLWSTGGAKPGASDEKNRSRWITNWGAN